MTGFTLQEYEQHYLNEYRLAACYDKKWFKLFVPKAYAGQQASMLNGCKTLLNVAQIQGGLGWTVNLGAGANWFSGFFEDSVASFLFSPADSVIAGSGSNSGTWRKTNDGYTISGQWSKCTGAAHASLFTVIASNAQNEAKIFIVPKNQVQLCEEKWPIMGMRNSSSFSISLENAKVPSTYAFEMNDIKNTPDYGVLHIPFQSFARLCMSASYIGVVMCLIDQCKNSLRKPTIISLIDDQLMPLIVSSTATLYTLAQRAEETALLGAFTQQQADELQVTLGQNNLQLFSVVQQLFLIGGLPFIEEDKLVHWAYRDVLTGIQHFMVRP
jgi:hypothetical protein